ncbi:hypothetical protein GT204_32970 [Streptomyces sp. SID4919]|uniref:hypothetical protein n=1 Tax=unclassified Streptomyces TaxID=2593676 RepID=UPI0008239349|nr:MULTISPECIES: hypothetical protein [unclassified Streptomyces]MYY13555.1 hypothetical protein [Streptomyces sp. SID4919]SCK32925.1 hypothetical protein YW7DRAFT_02660 [Streptomyces sp. AmelKG-E11A]
MRDAIARALVRVLDVLPWTRRTRPGRHSAGHLAVRTGPVPLVICAARTPIPVHVLARSVPSPWGHRVPPYLRDWIGEQEERERQYERRAAVAAAALGVDLPFTFDGSDVTRAGARAWVGMSA